MGLLDKFRKKKEPTKPEEKGSAPIHRQEKSQVAKSVSGSSMAHQILIRPLLSEKGTHLASKGEYVFVVAPGANKSEIRKAIQGVYEVHVRDVKIVKLPGKQRRYGRSMGRTSPRKKAIVKLRAGEKIPGIIEAVG